jgi:hypothetical protein
MWKIFLQDHILSTSGDALTLKGLKLDYDKWKKRRPVHNATPLCRGPSPSPTPTLNQRNPQFDPIPMVVEVGKYGQGEPSTHTGTFTFFFLEASWWSS